MAENITLGTVSSFANDSSAVAIVNNNSQLIENAFQNVLDRYGTAPNGMQAVLDMNSFNIINLPAPATINSPVRLVDVISPGVSLTVPPVGTSGSTVPLLNGLNTWSAGQLLNVSGLTAAGVTPGSRGPFMIWSNPGATIPAGQNAGMQIWVGDNPTATPGINSPIGLTVSVLNGNNRGSGPGSQGLWGVNLNVGQSALGAGYVQTALQGMEIDMYSDPTYTQAINPFQANWVTCLQLYNSPAVSPITNAITIWSAAASNSFWMYEGISVSRCTNFGIRFYTAPGDVSSAFGQAAIYDGSNSVTVLKADSTHTNGIDFSTATFTNAIKTPGFLLTGTGNITLNNTAPIVEFQISSSNVGYIGATSTFLTVNTNSSSNALLLGTNNTTAVTISGSTQTLQLNSANSFSANASVATALSSIGPVGSHTTVQTWLTIVDNTGTTRYIPCF